MKPYDFCKGDQGAAAHCDSPFSKIKYEDRSENMSSVVKPLDKKRKIMWLVSVIIAAGLMGIPTGDIYTTTVRNFLAITVFCLLLMAFDLLDMMAIALLLPGCYIAFGVTDAATAYSSWTSTTCFLIAGAFILTNVMTEVGLLQRVSYWLLCRSAGSFNKMLYIMYFTSVLLGVCTFTNSFIITGTLALGICKTMQYGQKDREALLLFIATYFGTICPQMFLYFPAYVSFIDIGGKNALSDFSFSWYGPFLHNWPNILFSLGFIFIAAKIFKAKEITFPGGQEYFEAEYKKLGRMTSAEKKTAFVFLLVILYLMTSQLHKLDASYAFILIPILLFVPGINVGSRESIKNCNYGLIFFIASCLAIGNVGAAIGISDIVSELVTPILEDRSSVFILGFTYVFGVLVNFLMTPVAILSAFATPFAQIAVDLGMNPTGILMALFNSVDQVFLPYESATVLAFCGFGIIGLDKIFKIFSIKVITFGIFMLIISIPYWSIIGSI